MYWKRKLYSYTAVTWGYYVFSASKNAVVSKCESSVSDKIDGKNSSYIYIPEATEEYFNVDSSWLSTFSIFQTNTPLYWKLFMLTKSKNRSVRHKAIKLLSETKLKEWEYMMIAQACGSSTAVGLARSAEPHLSFFFLPPFRTSQSENLNKEILNILVLLHNEDVSSPVHVLCEKAFKISKRILSKNNLNLEPENFIDLYHSELKRKNIFDFNKLFLQIVLYHSTISSHRFLLVKNGILKILWEITSHFEKNVEIQSLIAQILSNISLEKELISTLYATGWIGILASWSKSLSINVCLPSAKALANLDTDDFHHSLYEHDIYLLHPLTRKNEKEPSADVIFVHGIFGGTFWTWRQNDTMKNSYNYIRTLDNMELSPIKNNDFKSYTFCWPKDWFSLDFPNLRVLSIDYNTDVRSWRSLLQKENETLNTTARSVMKKLIKANVGNKPIIWITHSMGGILVKQILIEAAESKQAQTQLIARNTVGVIFFSVPHKGSEFVTLLQSVPYIFPSSAEISQFYKGSSTLLSLQDKFMKLVQQNNINILSFGERKKSKWGLDLVSEDSSNPGVGEFYTLSVDHLSTCKPESRNSEAYCKVKDFIEAQIPLSNNTVTDRMFEICNILCLVP